MGACLEAWMETSTGIESPSGRLPAGPWARHTALVWTPPPPLSQTYTLYAFVLRAGCPLFILFLSYYKLLCA